MAGALAVLLAWTVEALLLLTDRERGVFALIEAGSELERTRLEIGELEHRRDALRAQNVALADDSRAIEAAAREELGMVFPGERLLHISEGDIR
jgi:cell division protein FtsB